MYVVIYSSYVTRNSSFNFRGSTIVFSTAPVPPTILPTGKRVVCLLRDKKKVQRQNRIDVI
jgi:hypothetical protein